MGESVNGIRGAFYSDIIYDYQCKYDDKREKSFLYRAFWAEGVSGLLKRLDRSLSEHLAGDGHESPNPLEKYMAPFCPNSRPGSWDYPWHLAKQPLKPGDESRIKEQLAAAMAEHPAWAKGLLTKTVPEKGRKERRDFWEELWLRDAAYRAGLITDTDYYLWLVEYLAVRDIYYKDNSIANAHLWLKRLLHKTGVAGEDLAVKANVEKKLAEAAELQGQVNALAGKAAGYEELKKAFSQDGIPHNIIRSIIPIFEATATNILGQMSQGRMSVEFVTEKVLKSNAKKEVTTLDIIINDSDTGRLPYMSRSGGERVKAALSVILALSEIKSSKAGVQLGFLFIDEPPFLDGPGVQAYCDALEAIQQRYGSLKVMAITHDPAMKSRFPQSVDVVKTAEGSKVIYE